MQNLKPFFLVSLLFFGTHISAQEIVKCDSTKAYWVIAKDQHTYALLLQGHYQITDRPGLIALNGYALQFIIINKKSFAKEEYDTDLKLLIAYALDESKYLSEALKTKLNVQFRKSPLSNGKDALLWYYEMPELMNQQVKQQIYVNTIIDDKIIGFASPQFSDQKFETVRDFLMDSISALKKVENINNLCQ